MDFDPLKSRAKRCLYEARYWWLAVALLEFIFLAAVCADTLWSSPESREFLKLASIAVVVGLAYSFFGIRQRLNANRSIRSAQLVFEGLMADFKGVEASNDRFRMELSESQLKCIDLQTKLDAATLDLEKARRENDGFREELKGAKANEKADLEKALEALKKELAVAQEKLDLIKYLFRDEITAYNTLSDADVLRLVLRAINERDWLRKKLEGAEASSDRLKGSLKRSLESRRELQKKLRATERNADNALYARDTARDIAKGVISERNGLRTERDELLAEIDKLKRENFALREELGDTDDALVESCSQLASVCSKLDDLQSKLSKLVAERNQLQAEVEAEINNLNKKLTAANAGFQWYQGKCISAERRVNHAKQQIADLEGALKKAISALPKETHGDE